MQALAQLNYPRRVIGLVPASRKPAERHGDKARRYPARHVGKTVEVINTDAEGGWSWPMPYRMLYKFKPACIIDLATLTGAVVVALKEPRYWHDGDR